MKPGEHEGVWEQAEKSGKGKYTKYDLRNSGGLKQWEN